jgi:DNA-directed RNA polymerase subunit RPC12/RpoP
LKKHLKSLRHSNAARHQSHEDAWNAPRRNGFKCPECGDELWDSEPDITHETIPPHKKVKCKECGYTGTRVA